MSLFDHLNLDIGETSSPQSNKQPLAVSSLNPLLDSFDNFGLFSASQMTTAMTSSSGLFVTGETQAYLYSGNNMTQSNFDTTTTTSLSLFDLKNFLLATFLICLGLATILGNIFVLLAISVDFHLRSPTHFLMGSLAMADLLLGILVLPFSSAQLYFDMWPFGEIYCEIWLDVLCCTASIYLVLVISIDRYIGVTRPLRYNGIMTKRRVFLIIVFVWTLSLIVSLAPQIGWKAPQRAGNICEVNNDIFYALFSASLSYYIPLVITLIIYFRVYQEARAQMKFLTTGSKVSTDGTQLRVHIGPSNKNHQNASHNNLTMQSSSYNISSSECAVCAKNRRSSSKRRRRASSLVMEDSKQSVSLMNSSFRSKTRDSKTPKIRISSIESIGNSIENETNLSIERETSVDQSTSQVRSSSIRVKSRRHYCQHSKASDNASLQSSSTAQHPHKEKNGNNYLNVLKTSHLNGSTVALFSNKIAKFKREQKAAKTLAIVVGCLIVCWLPFFITLPLDSFKICSIPNWLFRAIFWLGYCNSAMNPLIYAFSSREFRRAYKGILKCNLKYIYKKEEQDKFMKIKYSSPQFQSTKT